MIKGYYRVPTNRNMYGGRSIHNKTKEIIHTKSMIGNGQHDEWIDTNVDIIGEVEKAGVPVSSELSLVNTVGTMFKPKLPQFNPKTRQIRPAPGLFDFLNFRI